MAHELGIDSSGKAAACLVPRSADGCGGKDCVRYGTLERRSEKRHGIQLTVSYSTLSTAGDTPVEFIGCITIDACRQGVSLLVDEPMSVPILLRLQLYIPGFFFGLPAVCRAVYCTAKNELGLYRMGLEFVGDVSCELRCLLSERRDR